MSEPKRRVRLAAHFPGVNNTTVWSDPLHRSQIEPEAFAQFARTAERGRFDYLFLAEGLRLREQKGLIHELDVAGRPNTLGILAALAAQTRHIGLVGTLSATFNEPAELARQLASLDHLSGGRAGWNVVTSSDAFHGANFRRGGFLDHADRYRRAAEFIELADRLWSAWPEDAVVAARGSGRFLSAPVPTVRHRGPQFDVAVRPTVPRSPQGRPVIVQAGDSPEGRELAARHAEVVFSRHTEFDAARAFYDDVKGRLPGHGRSADSLLILPAVTFAIGDTDAEAVERARHDALAQVSAPTAIAFLEQVWGVDLSHLDADGPLPDFDPDPDAVLTAGRVRHFADPVAVARAWRERAEAQGLTARQLVAAETTRTSLVGTPAAIAAEIDRYVQERAVDGFVVVGTTSPHGLDEFVARVVPELQERGVYRTEYEEGATLRQTLGLPPLDAVDESDESAEVRRAG